MIDTGLVSAAQVMGAVFGGVLSSLLAQPGAKVMSNGFAFGWLFWGAAFFVLNSVVLQGLTGSSIGKRMVGLQVVGDDGRPTGIRLGALRAVMQLVSAIPLYAGYLVSFFDEKRRTWHDLIAGTSVVQITPHAENETQTEKEEILQAA